KFFECSNLNVKTSSAQFVEMSNQTVVNQPDSSQYWPELPLIRHCGRMSVTWRQAQPVVPVSRWGRGRTVRALFLKAARFDAGVPWARHDRKPKPARRNWLSQRRKGRQRW